MALYMPASARRRRLVALGLGALVVGVTAGWAIGRSTSPTVGDQVRSTRAHAQRLDAQLQALPFEYDKALSAGTDMSAPGGPVSALDAVASDAAALAGGTEWIGPHQRAALGDVLSRTRTDAIGKVPSAAFKRDVDSAVALIDQTFGVSQSP